jgi:FHS family L-fucose permease-like MFS transporter
MSKTRFLLPIVMIVSLFFLWGVANNLNDVLIAHFRKAFALADWQSGLVQSAFYLGYFFFAVPAALFARKFGYKGAILCGLGLYGLGALLFYPAAEIRSYGAFLGALFVIASGLAFLETSANPLVTLLGEPSGAERRLNLAQAFNPLGSITGVLIGQHFILSDGGLSPEQEAMSVQSPYLVLGLLVLAWGGAIWATRFPPTSEGAEEDGEAPQGAGQIRRLLGHRHFLFGVAAQFAYVGAQVGIWSFLIRYAGQALPGTGDKDAATFLSVSLLLFMAGRFAGAALMGRFSPHRLTALFAGLNTLLCIAGAFAGGWIGLGAMIGTSFFMSVMYPTIFALSIKGLGPLAKLGSSLLVMSIVGGAAIPVAMGRVSDFASIASAMLVPGFCFVVVGAFALSPRREA